MKEYQAARKAAVGEPVQFAIVRRDGSKEVFTCEANAPAIPLLDLAGRRDITVNSLEALAALDGFLMGMLVPEDVQRFRKVATEERLDFGTLMEIVRDVVEDTAGRPTERPSFSEAGPSNTSEPSKVVSLSQGTVREVS